MDAHREVFKYTDINGALKILGNGTLKFSTPECLNDPFDFSDVKIFDYDYTSVESMQHYIDEHINILFCEDSLPPFNNSQPARMTSWMRSEFSKKSKEDLKKAHDLLLSEMSVDVQDIKRMEQRDKDTRAELKKSFMSDVIFCGATSNMIMPLWTHYAEKHKGAVFKFVPNKEKDSVLRLLKTVNYSDNKICMYKTPKDFLYKSLFGKLNDNLSAYIAEHTHTKGASWSYEREIRVFVPNVPNRPKFSLYNYHSNELAALYLGYKMDEDIKQLLIDLANKRNPNVEIYQMVKPEQGRDYELGTIKIK